MDRIFELIQDPVWWVTVFVASIIASIVGNFATNAMARRLTESSERFKSWRSAKSEKQERIIGIWVRNAEADPQLARYYQHLEARTHRTSRLAFNIMGFLAFVAGILAGLAWASSDAPFPTIAAAVIALLAALAATARISYANQYKLYAETNHRVGTARERRLRREDEHTEEV